MNINQAGHQPTVRDVPPSGGDSYARESFTWRRMRPWQIWTLAIVAVGVVAAGWLYLL